MKPAISIGIVALALLVSPGCKSKKAEEMADNIKASKAEPPKAAADPADVVAELKAAGFELKTNSNGNVISASTSMREESPETLKMLAELKQLETIILGGPGTTDAGLEILSGMKKLKRVDLTRTQVTDQVLEPIGKNQNIEVLILRQTGVTDAGLENIVGLKKLRALDLRNTVVSNEGLKFIGQMKSLVDLQLERGRITDPGLEQITGLQKLRNLNLNTVLDLTDESLKHIGKLKSLEALQMDSTQITDEGLVHLKDLEKLKRLRVRECFITSDGIQHLEGKDTLERLELRLTVFDDVGMSIIGALPNLNYLDLSECTEITSEGFKSLAGNKKLTYLGCWETEIDDGALAELTKLPIEELDLRSTSITNASGEHLAKMPKLSSLNLEGNQIDDELLKQLANSKSLTKLTVSKTGVTSAGIEAIKQAIPNLKVAD